MSSTSATRLLPSRLGSHLSRAQSHAAQDFNYTLPQSRIATRPLPDRSSSKLLVVPGHTSPRHLSFRDLPSLLPRHALLILNASRVIPARLPMRKTRTSGAAQLMLLSPTCGGDPAAALARPASQQTWNAYVGGRRVRVGDVLRAAVGAKGRMLQATVLEKDAQSAQVRFAVQGDRDTSLAEMLQEAGQTPLPPYIKRAADEADRGDYQTVYASLDGSVAAPTAGLHVTEDVLRELGERGVRTERVVLHVGAGTFAPVDADTVGGHRMHQEQICVSGSMLGVVRSQLENRRPIVALGTTSVRTLESIYWFGARLLMEQNTSPPPGTFHVGQWEPYETMDQSGREALPPAETAVNAMLEWNGNRDSPILGNTELLIVPGYPFKMVGILFIMRRVDALVTNFHQPRSTLLMLVSAFHGGEPEDLFRVYNDALEKGYRFLSYGDSSIFADPTFFSR